MPFDIPKLNPEQLREAYQQALKAHDWHHQFSDDAGAVRRGAVQRAALVRMQQDLDPGYELWNAAAPKEFQITPQQPAPSSLVFDPKAPFGL
jgi:hypothetical protein